MRRGARRFSAWAPLPPDVYLRPASDRLPFPLNRSDAGLYGRGRAALWHGLRALGLRPGDGVLAPAYHHGSEIEVFARLGLRWRFYRTGETLEPDAGHLDSLLASDVRALHLIHYLGFPQDSERWRRWCDERRLLLIEDAAMAWLATVAGAPVGSHGDLAVYCLYKTFGLPDGAALVSRRAPGSEPAAGGHRFAEVAHLHAAWLSQRFAVAAVAGQGSGALGEHESYDPTEDFALGDPNAPASTATRFLLPRLAYEAAAARRRANHALLLEALGDRVPEPFGRISVGASPFAFPLETSDKHALLERLRERGIDALDLWSAPHPSLPVDEFPAVRERRASTVCLPVHQELRPDDLERIAAAALPTRRRSADARLESIADLDAVADDWRALAAGSGNVFGTWEWASLWWRHFGYRHRLLLTAARRPGGEPLVLVPLCAATAGRLRVVRFVGHGPADQLGPIHRDGDEAVAARCLRGALSRLPLRWDLFVGDHLPGGSAWGALLGARVTRREASPAVRIATRDWESFLATLSGHLRKRIRYQERRLKREHELSFRLSTDPERLDADFDELCRLHALRWRSGQSTAFAGPRRAFLREFAHDALRRGRLRLWFLELDRRPVAAWLGFRLQGVESYYQGGRDPAWDDRSVGAVLVMHSVREAVHEGMTEYRFLRGDEPYKDRLATHDHGVETVLLSGSAAGRASLAASALRQLASRSRSALARSPAPQPR
jgi:CelD/BcsL family acetyltransferase involved in cellulose biosynthesis/dTDP-4-amino-4,6-dideoxygalactose transaminase